MTSPPLAADTKAGALLFNFGIAPPKAGIRGEGIREDPRDHAE
jgi:hypothetical protein